MLGLAIEIIQSICLIIAAVIILITALGILRLDDDMEKVIYVRIHMLGMVDIACVLAMIGLGQYLIAGVYFVLAPFVAHAMANAYYHGEDDRKYETNDELLGRVNDTVYTELALSKDTTIDADFKSAFESSVKSSKESINDFSINSSDLDSRGIGSNKTYSYSSSPIDSSVDNSSDNSDDNYSANDSSNNSSSKTTLKSDVVSYTKIEESKGSISNKLDVVIKEVSTDDIENSNLSKDSKDNSKDNNKANNISNNNKDSNKLNTEFNTKKDNKDEDRGEKHD